MSVSAKDSPENGRHDQFLADFFHELDNDGHNATDFYAEDGVFVVGTQEFSGHAGIRQFYVDRLARVRAQRADAVRTARHVFANLRISDATESSATLDFISITYAGEGPPPVAGMQGPAVISDCTIHCQRGDSSKWLIKRFEGSAVFLGNDAVAGSLSSK